MIVFLLIEIFKTTYVSAISYIMVKEGNNLATFLMTSFNKETMKISNVKTSFIDLLKMF